ncbi:hypothetical protein [Streptomyces sp. NPDC007083]
MEHEQVYRGQSVMWGTVLPSRVVYLIEARSTDGFRQAVRTACSRWGGVGELIIGVDPDEGVSVPDQRLVGLADLEAAANVNLSGDRAMAAAETLGMPLVDVSQLGTHPATCYSYPLAAFAGGDQLLMAQEDAPLWQVAAAGDQPFEEPLQIPVRRAMQDTEIGRAQSFWYATLVEGSSYQFREHSSADVANTSAVIWIVDHADPLADCLEFWNMRALRPRRELTRIPLLLLPHRDVESWHAFKDHVHAFLARHGERNVDVVLRSNSVEEAHLHRLAATWELQQQTAQNLSFGIPAPWVDAAVRTPPFMYTVNLDPSRWLAVQRDWGLRQDFDVHTFTDRPTGVRFRSPVRLQHRAQVLVRLTGEALDGLPRHRSVAQRIHPDAQWRGEHLQVGVVTDSDVVLELNLPSLEAATTQLLNSLVTRWEL